LKPLFPGLEKKKTAVKGIVAQYLGTSAYSTIEGAATLFGEGEVMNAVVIKLDDPVHRREVMNLLEGMPYVNTVQSGSDALESLEKNMGAMSALIGFVMILAAVLSIAVIYNITTINMFERRKELATLMVLGFKDTEVIGLIFKENYLITAFGILLGIPAGKYLTGYLMQFYETDFYSFPIVLNMESYLLAALMTAAFTVFANLILRRKITGVDMVGALKSNE
jgi:putative ABC transport system permease protein